MARVKYLSCNTLSIMVERIKATSILNKLKNHDSWFLNDYSATPYRGCQFGCLYCYIQGSKYGNHTAGSLAVKANAPELFARQLRRRAEKKEYGFIFLGSSTDPYMPLEEESMLTRRLLDLILSYRFPVEVCTKSTLVTRDIDLLQKINETAILPVDLEGKLDHRAIVAFSLSTVDDGLAAIFEPGAPAPSERFKAMKKCKDAGLLVGVNLMPVLPGLSDDVESIDRAVSLARQHGADYILAGGLTLFGNGPGDSKTKYFEALGRHFPELLPRYESLFLDNVHQPQVFQAGLEKLARMACERHGIRYGILPCRSS